MRKFRRSIMALVLAVVRGLLLDLDATGDAERADRAFADFVALLPSGGTAPAADVAPSGPSHR